MWCALWCDVQEARQQGIPVLVEGERPREYLEQLLPLADYVVTSTHFPYQVLFYHVGCSMLCTELVQYK